MTAPGRAGVADQATVATLVGDMGRQVQDLLRQEVELAKLEARDQLGRASKAGALMGAAGVAALFATLLAAFAAAWGLAEAVPPGLAFLAVSMLLGVVAALLFSQGRRAMAGVNPVPGRALASLREDLDVVRSSVARGATSEPEARWGRHG